MTSVRTLERIDVVSADPARLADFYEALGFTRSRRPFDRGETRVGMRLGAERIELLKPERLGAPYPAAVAGWSLWFQHFAIVVSDMREAYRRLKAQAGWTAISTEGPVLLPDASGGATAFKFRDPEGHPLELIAFPDVRTPEHWRANTRANLFLGIDHSAISVADTQRSALFYENLGLVRAGGSFNTGVEQALLDDIVAPAVEVTALAPAISTPHVELLCYKGDFERAAPPLHSSDIAATRLVFGETASVMLRDPDGHLVVVDEGEPYSGST